MCNQTYCARCMEHIVWRCPGKTDNYQANAGSRGTKNSMVSGEINSRRRGQLCSGFAAGWRSQASIRRCSRRASSSRGRESLQTTCVAIICRRRCDLNEIIRGALMIVGRGPRTHLLQLLTNNGKFRRGN